MEEEQPRAEDDSRQGYYRVARISDGDISMKSINDDKAAPESNKTDPDTRIEGVDQRVNTSKTKRLYPTRKPTL